MITATAGAEPRTEDLWPRREWDGGERPTPGSYPAACEECQLYQTAKSWAVEPCWDDRPNMEGRPWVLLVGQAPSVVEDREGVIFRNSRGAGGFLRPLLDEVPFRWILTNAARCHPGRMPGGRDKAPSEKQARLCSSNSVPELIEAHGVRVVLALGAVAMRAVLGKSAPKSIRAAGAAPWRVPGADRWVFVAEHPALHRPSEGKDLGPSYQRMFADAWRVTRQGVTRPEINYRVISDSAEACAWAESLSRKFWLDVEDDHHKNDPERASIHHPRARILSCSFTDVDGNTTVLLPPALLDPRVLHRIFLDSEPEGHNVKYEIQSLDAEAKFDILPLVRRLPTGEAAFGCTLLKCALPNQGKTRNGLKTVVQDTWGAEDWSQPVWEAVDRANKAISGSRQWLRSWRTREKNRADRVEKVGLFGPESRQGKTALRWLERDREKNPEDFRADLPRPRPLGSAGFGDVPLDVLVPYNAQDTYWPRRIALERVPAEAAAGRGYNELAYRLCLRLIEVTCRVERNGMPLDRDRLERLNDELARRIAGTKVALMREPVVREAVLQTNVVKKALAEGKPLTGELLLEACNPQATSMRLELARACGIPLDRLPPTKKGNPSVNKVVMGILAGEGRKWADLTEGERIWHAFRQLRNAQDLRSKFLSELSLYCVDGRVRTDFKVVRVEGVGREAGSETEGGAGTGRTSSRNPNMQNLKKERVLRSLFVAPPGWVFLEADYDRIEPVVLAAVAQVRGWQAIFRRGLDLYRVIANDVYKLGIDLNCPDDEANRRLEEGVEKKIRNGIKVRLLAIMYDESARSFAAKAGVPEAEVLAFFRDFYRAYPEIRDYKERIRRLVHAGEWVTTPFGRQVLYELPRRGPDYDKDLARMIRQALNIPIQSTASDLTIWKAWELQRYMDAAGWNDDAQLVNLVHDSVWSLVKEERALEFARMKRRILEDMSTLPTPELREMDLRSTFKRGRWLAEAEDEKCPGPLDMVEVPRPLLTAA